MRRKPLRCRLGFHAWTKHVREGQSWLECPLCGKNVDQARSIFGYRDSSRW